MCPIKNLRRHCFRRFSKESLEGRLKHAEDKDQDTNLLGRFFPPLGPPLLGCDLLLYGPHSSQNRGGERLSESGWDVCSVLRSLRRRWLAHGEFEILARSWPQQQRPWMLA